MKNIKTKSYILGLFTLITLGVTYAYTSVSSSLTYLRGAGDIGHIGYIITEIFDTNVKIKPNYLPEGMVVENASVTQTGIVKLVNATGSISEVEAPTINILTQVWNNLNTRINTLVSSSITSETDPTVNTLAKVTLSCSNNQLAKWNGSTWVCSSDNDTIYTHPANHSPNIITQDANNRFVTDTEKSTWNNKQNALGYTPLNKAGDTLTGLLKTRDTLGGIGENGQGTPGFEILSPNSSATDAAYMTFHRPNLYAVRFGLDTDNKLKVGGWSMGNNSYEISHAGNLINVTNSTSTTQAPTANALKLVNDTANTKAPIHSPTLTGTPKRTTAPTDGDASNELATTARVKANTVSASSTMTFSTCSTTDKKEMFYECDPTLSACSTVGAYCGGGKVAGTYGGSIIVSALSDEGQNTWGYASSYGNMNPATQMCWEKGSFGFDDWQLPNKEELNLLYTNRTTIGGFGTSNYWSSTEVSTNTGNAWSQNFSTGTPSSVNSKTTTYLVRCIRKY